jgi:hypothetical protein
MRFAYSQKTIENEVKIAKRQIKQSFYGSDHQISFADWNLWIDGNNVSLQVCYLCDGEASAYNIAL